MSEDVTILTSDSQTSLVKTLSGSDLKVQLFAIGKCLAPYIRPLVFGFSNKVSGTGGRMFNAW